MPCFNPRAPCGARPGIRGTKSDDRVSIHAPRVGRDFQDRLCFGGCRVSIHAPRVGRDAFKVLSLSAIVVSIHAPRVGRDMISDFLLQRDSCFNPRAPCGARPTTRLTRCATARFQSTRPVWGATRKSSGAGRDGKVSIHAPRVGRDFCTMFTVIKQGVSIHAPRVGRDTKATTETAVQIGFNPRAPCGARQFFQKHYRHQISFNPRAPCGARPELTEIRAFGPIVSIHAPRVGRDTADRAARRYGARFNPRAPCGARQLLSSSSPSMGSFQSTRPVWGATELMSRKAGIKCCFNPRAPCGARL